MADEVLSQSEIDKLLSALSDGTVSAEEVKCRTFSIFLRRVLVEFGQGFEFVHIVLFEDIEFFAYLDEGLHAAVELAAVVRG